MSDKSGHPPAQKKSRDKWRIQAWIYDQSEDSRIRNAYDQVGLREGYADLSDFILKPVLENVARLEEKYNGGEPFLPLPPEAIRGRGRGRTPRPGKAVE